MDYGNILKKAWQSIWKNKILWVFAVLAGQLSIRGLLQTLLTPMEDMLVSPTNPFQQMLDTTSWTYNLNLDGVLLWLLLGVLLLSGLIRFCVTILSATGLIRGLVWERQSKQIQFLPLFKHSLRFFWRYLALSFLIAAVVLIALMPIIIPILLEDSSGSLIFICLFCGIFPVMIFLTFWLGQTLYMMVVDDLKIFEALSKSWVFVVQTHFGKYFAMFMIILGISLGVSIVIALPSILINMVNVGATLFNENASISTIATPLMRVFSVFFEILSAFVTALATLFSTAVWVHFYLDLKEVYLDHELPLPQETPSPQLESSVEEEISTAAEIQEDELHDFEE